MAVEIEKKYRLTPEQRERVAADLSEYGAGFIREDFEENILYRGGILNENGAVLRIRKTADRTMLTYKQQFGAPGSFKQHTEYESLVEDAGEIALIIEALGFERSLIYEKRRKIWKFREVEVVIDELPFGLFMEIEGTVIAIREAELLLGAEEFEDEPLTYPRLAVKHGTQCNGIIEARFSE